MMRPLNPALVVLHALAAQPMSLGAMMRALGNDMDSTLLGRVWNALRESGQIEPVRDGLTDAPTRQRYRVARGIVLHTRAQDVLSPELQQVLGIQPVSSDAARTQDALHIARSDAIIAVLAHAPRLGLPPKKIYESLPARPGGKSCDYVQTGRVLADLLRARRVVVSGVGAGRRYALPGGVACKN